MAFQKGVSGNSSGRPKQTPEEKEERERFKELLKSATVTALTNIIQIANDKHSRDRFKANTYLIDKAYGNNAVLVSSEGIEDIEPVQIIITPYHKKAENEDEDWEESPDDDWE